MVRKEAITKPVTCCWSYKVRKHPQQGGSLLSQQQNCVGIFNLAPRFELLYNNDDDDDNKSNSNNNNNNNSKNNRLIFNANQKPLSELYKRIE